MPFTDRARIRRGRSAAGQRLHVVPARAQDPEGRSRRGNGGRGGRVVLVADDQVVDLSRFRHAVHHRAPNGGHGEGRCATAKPGRSCLVPVPPGTRVLRDGTSSPS